MITEIYLYEFEGEKKATVWRQGKPPKGYHLSDKSAHRVGCQLHDASLRIPGEFRPVLTFGAFGFTFERRLK